MVGADEQTTMGKAQDARVGICEGRSKSTGRILLCDFESYWTGGALWVRLTAGTSPSSDKPAHHHAEASMASMASTTSRHAHAPRPETWRCDSSSTCMSQTCGEDMPLSPRRISRPRDGRGLRGAVARRLLAMSPGTHARSHKHKHKEAQAL